MNKTSKMLIVVSVIVFLVLGAITSIVFYFASLEPEKMEYPGSGLSGSIFDVQNSTYTENAGLPEVYKYKNVPYLLDVPQSTSAVVDNGSIWRLANNFYMFTTELPFNGDINSTIGHELGKIILLDNDDNRTLFDEIKEESGYRNGFGALYQIKKMYLSNGERSVETIVMLYLIELPSENEDVIIGTLCINETNDNIRRMKNSTDELFMTFRYSEDREKEMLEEAKQQTIQDQKEERQKAADELNEERKQALEEQEAAKEEKTSVVTSETPIEITSPYDRLKVDVSWKNYNSVQSLELVSPAGEYYTGVLESERSGYIEASGAMNGTWKLRVTGVNVGEVEITLTELGTSAVNDEPVQQLDVETVSTEEEVVTTTTEE